MGRQGSAMLCLMRCFEPFLKALPRVEHLCSTCAACREALSGNDMEQQR